MDFLFSSCDGLRPIHPKTFYKYFNRALQKIGISKEERKRRNLTFLSYRLYLLEALSLFGYLPDDVLKIWDG